MTHSAEPITAIYEGGVLKPRQPLALRENQLVQILVLDEDALLASENERLFALERTLAAWLDTKPALTQTLRPVTGEQRATLDNELDQLLGELRHHTQHDSAQAIADIVDEALTAVRRGTT